MENIGKNGLGGEKFDGICRKLAKLVSKDLITFEGFDHFLEGFDHFEKCDENLASLASLASFEGFSHFCRI